MLEQEWINKQNSILSGDKNRGIKPKRKYLHFDTKISELDDETSSNIFNKDWVSTHSFFPFIQYEKTFRRRKKAKKFSGFELKRREISYSAHLDTLVFSWYANQLGSLYEKELNESGLYESVLAYRSNMGSNIDHACTAFRNTQSLGEANIVCSDISGFFDNLSHRQIKRIWLALLKTQHPELDELPEDHYKVFRAITKFSYVDIEAVYKKLNLEEKDIKLKHRLCSAKEFREKIAQGGIIKTNNNKFGIPQGSSISAVIANIYMLEFDKNLAAKVRELGGFYYRYSDDIFVSTPKEVAVRVIEETISTEITKQKLSISSSKTERYQLRREKEGLICRNFDTNRRKNLNYLGMCFDGRRVLLKHASLANYHKKVLSNVRSALRYSIRHKTKVPKRSLYRRFTRMGRNNFQTYIKNCLDTLRKHGFDSQYLKRQASDYFVTKTLKKLEKTVELQMDRRRRRQEYRARMRG